jgi:hypothetical protein
MGDVGGLKDLRPQLASLFGAAVVYVCGRVVADAGVAVLLIVLNGGLLNREKVAYRHDTPRLGDSRLRRFLRPKVPSLGTVLRVQQRTFKEDCEIACYRTSRSRCETVA